MHRCGIQDRNVTCRYRLAIKTILVLLEAVKPHEIMKSMNAGKKEKRSKV